MSLRLPPFLALLPLALAPLRIAAQEPLTLDAALREADSANALLPVARSGMAAAGERVRAAEGRLWPSLSVEGDLHDGTPAAYAAGDARLQLVADQVIYDGGALRAKEAASWAGFARRRSSCSCWSRRRCSRRAGRSRRVR